MLGKSPAAELDLRNRVVQTALMLHAQFGWPAGVETYAPQNPRIAANKMASKTPVQATRVLSAARRGLRWPPSSAWWAPPGILEVPDDLPGGLRQLPLDVPG